MNTNCRNTRRFNLTIPVKLQRLDLLDPTEHTMVSSNVSEGGIFVRGEVPLEVGTPVRVFLNMPRQISGKPSAMRCYEGRVAHAHETGHRRNQCGIGVAFRFYEVLASPGAQPTRAVSPRKSRAA